jgi:cellulose synthase operon protein C
MPEQLNLRRLGWLVATLLLLAAGLFFLHRFQLQRNAVNLRDLSRWAESQGRADRAAHFLNLYLSFVPQDTAARADYGTIVENMAHTAKDRQIAMELYDQVLLEDPDRRDIRLRLARLQVEAGDFSEALRHLRLLGEKAPDDADVSFLAGLCYEGQLKYDQAAKEYRRVIRSAPHRIDSCEHLARLLRRHLDAPKAAEEIMDQMVAANRKNHRAYLSRALYHFGGENHRAEADLQQARSLAPKDVDVLLVSAQLARQHKKIPEARRHLSQALDTDPGDARLYLEKAHLEAADGSFKEAISILRQALGRSPGTPQLLFTLADLLLETGDLSAAGKIIAEMRRWKLPPSQVALNQARLSIAEGKWAEARETLEANRPLLVAESPERLVEANLLLGRCYAALGDSELELSAYRLAAADPRNTVAQEALGQALARLGRLEEAVGQYQKLVADPKAGPEVWMMYAKLRVFRRLSLPPGDGRWSEVEQVLETAARRSPGAADLDLLRSEVLVARKKFSEAQHLLEAAATRHPRRIEFCLALASLAAREEKLDAALATLDAAEQKFGHNLELDFARLSVTPSLEMARTKGVLSIVNRHLPLFRTDQSVRLIDALAEAHLRWRDLPEARRLWLELAQRQPQDLSVRLRLFNLAAEAEDAARMEQLVREIQKIEGRDGPLGHYGQASLLFLRARRGERVGLDAARQHLAAAALQRPSWPLIPASRAMIAQLEGQPEQALTDYLRAVELGERRGVVIRQAVQLLYQRRRYAEADQLIHRLQSELRVSPELQKLAAEIALHNANPRQALELASGAVSADSKDWKALLWLSQVFLAAGRATDAQASLQRAVRVGGGAGEPWLALVHYHLRLSQIKEAEKVVEEAGRTLKGSEALLVMAGCYEAIGRTTEAEAKYLTAVKARPEDASGFHQLAAFYQRNGTPEKAVDPLRQLLSRKTSLPHEEVRWVRRALALCLAASGKHPAFQEALGLIETNLTEEPKSAPELYAKARVLGSHPGHRREALRLLEKQRDLSPDQEFYLARLHASTNNWPAARASMLNVLSREGDNPTYLRFFVEELFRRGAVSDGTLWLDRLERLAPEDAGTMVLRALALAKKGKGSEVVALIDRYVTSSPATSSDRLKRLRSAARILEQLGEGESDSDKRIQAAAEEVYSQVAKESGRAKDYLTLAEYVGRRRRVAEALELCEKAKGAPAADDVAITAVSIVCAAPATDEQQEKVERQVRACLKRNPNSVKLYQLLAVLQTCRDRYADAEASYRLILNRDDQNADALNNLACVLILQNRRLDEAQVLIKQAMSLIGPTASLLDTRGLLQMQVGHWDSAIADLREAVAQSPSVPRELHLAQAYYQAGRREDAERTLAKVNLAGGERALHLPADQHLYQQLQREARTQFVLER